MNQVTKHGEMRLRQRGLKPRDLDLVLAHGTSIDDRRRQRVILTRDDVKREVAKHKIEIQNLERLAGVLVVLEREGVLTTYRPRHRKEKRALRCGRIRGA